MSNPLAFIIHINPIQSKNTNKNKAKPGEKTRKLFDGGGLYIQIEPSGGKLWRYKYRFDGKEKTLYLGIYPDVTLQEARARHQEARKQLTQDIDPAAAKKAMKAARGERAANSFEVVALEWFDRWKNGKAAGTVQRALSILEKETFPYIGNRPISEIKTPDILTVLRRIEDRALIVKAHKAKDAISLVFRHAVQTGRAEYNPCDNLRGALQPVRKKIFPTFTEPTQVAERPRV